MSAGIAVKKWRSARPLRSWDSKWRKKRSTGSSGVNAAQSRHFPAEDSRPRTYDRRPLRQEKALSPVAHRPVDRRLLVARLPERADALERLAVVTHIHVA